MTSIKTLAMIKMEKNFRAVIEKNYPRKPYDTYTIGMLIDRVGEEMDEVIDAYDKLHYHDLLFELADVSNLIDYIFEQVTKKISEG